MNRAAIAIILATVLIRPAQAQETDWQAFGDWKVSRVSGEMDPTRKVVIRTNFTVDSQSVSEAKNFRFGFRLYGHSFMVFDVEMSMDGKNYWPYCDFDLSSYKIEGRSVSYFPTEEEGGSCDNIVPNAKFLAAWRSANSARLKLNGTEGTISLRGFSAAWQRALQLSR